MIRQVLTILAASVVLMFGGATGAMAQQSNPGAVKNPCAVKPMENPGALKGQSEGDNSKTDPSDAVRKAKSAQALADEWRTLHELLSRP